ncbi:hypothetical protein KW830_08190 [Comamonas sp. CMM03]|uniref:hypothetical protein n=1 Tax=Comamonas sp. CMM03 TaxID=2854781 RepID=UPI001C473192|nr:hypothetical protein [Comamonas sp. CMM03]MBV7418434.1 hypothetical protein [Comamonas sp. CMM03]
MTNQKTYSIGTSKTFAFMASIGLGLLASNSLSPNIVDLSARENNLISSSNWQEHKIESTKTSAYSVNVGMRSFVELGSYKFHSDFENTLEDFWTSLSDGSIFNDMDPEILEMTNKIVSANPHIADFI